MSENISERNERFVDPNSGAASQPGGFVAAPVVADEESNAKSEPTPTVPDNDTEAPAKMGDKNLDGTAEIAEGGDTTALTGGEESTTEEVDKAAEEAEEPTEPEGPNVPENGPVVPAEEESETKDYSELLGGNVKDVQKYLEENPEEKDAVIEAEKAGKNRTTIVDS